MHRNKRAIGAAVEVRGKVTHTVSNWDFIWYIYLLSESGWDFKMYVL